MKTKPRGQAELDASLAAADERSFREYKSDLKRRDKRLRHASNYSACDPGHPLGRGMPLGDPLREDGESHHAAWMRIVRLDPCAYCGGLAGTVDHIVPRSTGGRGLHNWRNYAAACEACNSKKGSMSLLEFLGKRNGIPFPAVKRENVRMLPKDVRDELRRAYLAGSRAA